MKNVNGMTVYEGNDPNELHKYSEKIAEEVAALLAKKLDIATFSDAENSIKNQIKNVITILDTNNFQFGINSQAAVQTHAQNTYRWLVPYKLKPYESVKNIIIGNLNTIDVQMIVETWKEENNKIIKTGEETVTIPKNASSSLEFKNIPFFYNTGENYGYVSFKRVNLEDKIIPFTTSDEFPDTLNALHMPLDGDSFNSSELVQTGSAKLLAMLTISKSSALNSLNNIYSVLDINKFIFGINYNVEVTSHSANNYRWAVPYRLKPFDQVKSIIVGNLNTVDVQMIVETWKEENNKIIKTGEETVTIPKNASSSLEFKNIPFFYNSSFNYGYITFNRVNSTDKIIPYTVQEDIPDTLNGLHLPTDGDEFNLSNLIQGGSAKLVAALTIEQSNALNALDIFLNMPSNNTIFNINNSTKYNDIIKAFDEANENDTLIFFPGEYIVPNSKYCNMRTKFLNLKGINRDSCIIKSYDGRYNYPPVWCSCGSIENLSIISEYKEGASNEIGTESDDGAYAIHCEDEYGVGKTLTISNCFIKSDFSAGIGAGLRKDMSLIVKDCEIINYQGTTRGSRNLGAVFFHDSVGEQGHSVAKFYNNIMRSNKGVTLRISNSIGGDNAVDCEFINNTLHDETENKPVINLINDPFNTNFTLSPLSRLNNSDRINNSSDSY